MLVLYLLIFSSSVQWGWLASQVGDDVKAYFVWVWDIFIVTAPSCLASWGKCLPLGLLGGRRGSIEGSGQTQDVRQVSLRRNVLWAQFYYLFVNKRSLKHIRSATPQHSHVNKGGMLVLTQNTSLTSLGNPLRQTSTHYFTDSNSYSATHGSLGWMPHAWGSRLPGMAGCHHPTPTPMICVNLPSCGSLHWSEASEGWKHLHLSASWS